jgi:F0F1-type ATP synthase epsilon subunit
MADELTGEETVVKKSNKADQAATKAAQEISSANTGLTMKVKVHAPFRTYFDGEAFSISAVNDTGPFDILPKHHNFMTLLNACDIVIRTKDGEERVTITRGIMHVKADQVVVFLDV